MCLANLYHCFPSERSGIGFWSGVDIVACGQLIGSVRGAAVIMGPGRLSSSRLAIAADSEHYPSLSLCGTI
jgi:hypothetical protein